jgi:hypothetical protein
VDEKSSATRPNGFVVFFFCRHTSCTWSLESHMISLPLPCFFSQTSGSVLVGQINDSCCTPMVGLRNATASVLPAYLHGSGVFYCGIWFGYLPPE